MNTLNKILELLERNDIQQQELAKFLGITKNNITSWKSGASRSYTKYLPQIATFFGVSVDYLIGSVGSLTDDLFRHLDQLCKKNGITFMEAMQKAGFTQEEIEAYYSGSRGIIFSKKEALAGVLGDDASKWTSLSFSDEKKTPAAKRDERIEYLMDIFSQLDSDSQEALIAVARQMSKQGK